MTDTTPIRFRRHGQVTLLRVVERPETWTTRSGKLMTVAIGDRVIMDFGGGIRSVVSMKPGLRDRNNAAVARHG